MKELKQIACAKCGTLAHHAKLTIKSTCSSCGKDFTVSLESRHIKCPNCGKTHLQAPSSDINTCSKCKNRSFINKYNLKIDTALVSSRHLYRSVYSLHEKSGLVSVPVDPDNILGFERESANPNGLRESKFIFLDESNAVPGEAGTLLTEAFDFSPQAEEDETAARKEFEPIGDRVPEHMFPPCVQIILKGIGDGRKRSLFILIKFLQNMGWDLNEIDKLLHDWNAKNPEPLREVSLKGQLRYHAQSNTKTLPPNCENLGYYKDFGVCKPDSLCRTIKNPVQYVRRRLTAQPRKRTRKKDGKKAAEPARKD